MMRIDVPADTHPVMHVWGAMVPGIGPAASAFSAAVYERTTLGLREFEAARLRVAQLNGCLFCLDWRTERDGETVETGFLDEVAAWRTSTALDDRARLAAEFAEVFVSDHYAISDGAGVELWARLGEHYTQAEQVELAMCVGSWLAFGRLNHVFGIDAACVLSDGPSLPAV